MENASYRQQFADATASRHYDRIVFAPDSYASLLWAYEMQLLRSVLADMSRAQSDVHYLDFACGTGRVLSFMESQVGAAVGIDISPHMLELARERVHRARLLCFDLTTADTLDASYDLITAFRFFLNAEDSLRRQVMGSLARQLRDRHSRLVFTVQSHVPSHKSISRSFKRWARSQPRPASYMTETDVVDLAAQGGLQILDIHGYDMLSGVVYRALPQWAGARLEAALTKGGCHRYGGHRLYIAGPKG